MYETDPAHAKQVKCGGRRPACENYWDSFCPLLKTTTNGNLPFGAQHVTTARVSKHDSSRGKFYELISREVHVGWLGKGPRVTTASRNAGGMNRHSCRSHRPHFGFRRRVEIRRQDPESRNGGRPVSLPSNALRTITLQAKAGSARCSQTGSSDEISTVHRNVQ